ncbi:MAG TPA: PKD domain-containing protein [bacterium]|nr:PKD domain-containing protein [bacterium]
MKPFAVLPALGLGLLLAGCSGSPGAPTQPVEPPPADPIAAALPAISPADWGHISDPDTGMAQGPLGIFWLVRDPQDPTKAALEAPREAAAQGDIYHLSIRPFMGPQHLQLTGSAPGPNGTTDYAFRFTHPFPMPADLAGPATAAKRVDLFIFDTTLVVAADGTDTFFQGEVRTNFNALQNSNGFRQLGPMVNPASLGIATANTFPYKLLLRLDPSNPAGNYDAATGWTDAEYLSPTGYDVIPQGALVDTTLRISNTLTQPLPLVVVAKYIDPRSGATGPEKRANRLPTADPAAMRYFLPQACGDIQAITPTVAGELKDDTSTDTATVTAQVLDWDNAAAVAAAYPDHANITHIAENSAPFDAAASFPELKAAGVFTASGAGQPYGVVKEWLDITIPVVNQDRAFTVPPGGRTVNGLIRIRDRQDFTAPFPLVVDESLAPSGDTGFEPSTRFQRVTVPVMPGTPAPNVTAVTPLSGISGTQATFNVTTNTGGPITTYLWGFGGGANPNTSSAASPTVTLGNTGTYTALLRATNSKGTQDFYFNLEILPASPTVTGVTPTSGFSLRQVTFSATTTGPAATGWAWDFGGGATPNTATTASPQVRLGIPGTYNASVTASNAGGSHKYDFTLTVNKKMVGLRLQVITNGTTYPRKLYNMSNWDLPGVQAWINTYFNTPFNRAGIGIDLNQISLVPVNNPTLFNIDTNSEVNQLWNLALGQNPDKLNAVVVNSVPGAPGLGGVMTDTNCNQNNSGRGCWIISFNEAFDTVVLPHELGHVMNLPHIRTASPINSNNYNLMSYGTLSNALFENGTSEEAASCTLWATNPHNQFQVSNNWTHQYLP